MPGFQSRPAVVLLLPIALALLLVTCQRERRKDPLIDGFLSKEKYSFQQVSWYRMIEVWDTDGLPQVPTATLNGEQLEILDWTETHAIYEDTLHPFAVDTTVDLAVGHYWGNARGRVNMPADFGVLQPDTATCLPEDSALTVVWSRSRGAGWYQLFVYLDHDYVDTLGRFVFFQFGIDTTVYDTFLRIGPERFYPPNVGHVVRGFGEVVVTAGDGPLTVQGAFGNITGRGYGYYRATNQPREIDFAIVNPRTGDRPRPGFERRNRARARHARGAE